jgi:hypothetical protein
VRGSRQALDVPPHGGCRLGVGIRCGWVLGAVRLEMMEESSFRRVGTVSKAVRYTAVAALAQSFCQQPPNYQEILTVTLLGPRWEIWYNLWRWLASCGGDEDAKC